MNHNEAIQLLEEMGLPETYRCPNCSEILLQRIRKAATETFVCTSCRFYFQIIECEVCRKKKYNHKLGMCFDCFEKSPFELLKSIKEKEESFRKLILITSRGKPNLSFSVSNELYEQLSHYSRNHGLSRKEAILKGISKIIHCHGCVMCKSL